MYDVLIVGLGCAGYTAAIYSARYKLKTYLVGLEEGGMGATAAEVGNWPGIIEIRGPDLMDNFKNHALSFEEVTPKVARVTKIEKIEGGFRLTLQSGETVDGKAVILATGSSKKHLGVPGENELSGKGVTYCATCDAFFYRNKDVAVIGGGDSAVEGAAIAAQVARKVYLVHRRKDFRAEPYWVEKVKAKENITMVLENAVAEIQGTERVSGIRLQKPFEGQEVIPLHGVFIEIGATPVTQLATDLGCETDAKGYLKVGADMATTVPGIFGAGDVTNASNYFAQFATAAGEASVAANSVFNYLSTKAESPKGFMDGSC
jgi:thioredoxin reductase (NADPH)